MIMNIVDRLGGAIYLYIQIGKEIKYDLTSASYSTGNETQYGKNLFINAANLRIAASIGDASRIKLGALNPEIDLYNLIGYDGVNTLAIPLYYVYTAIISDIYHVNNAASSYTIGSRYDNTFCGHYGWPCLTIGYAIDLSGSASEKKVGIITGYTSGIDQGNDNIGCGHFDYPCLTIYYAIQQNGSASAKKVMIINEYQLNFIVNVNLEGILIQRYIDAGICSSISDNSIVQINPQ
ncbi:MAG: hypothetical protein EZS28_003013 [Streblomastix strix]|uniref:Uncharacterized protein n=1 Tax=Streblomastix strix TaxID=222440 RepID=A0A5J4X2N6_9EUKA|nr:MAG: hypothetical protein EZS28_003013 [Streblomastix strix]